MSERLGKALLHGIAFIVISILILGLLLITTLAYFEWISVGVLEKLIYGSFIATFFIGTAIISKGFAQKRMVNWNGCSNCYGITKHAILYDWN